MLHRLTVQPPAYTGVRSGETNARSVRRLDLLPLSAVHAVESVKLVRDAAGLRRADVSQAWRGADLARLGSTGRLNRAAVVADVV